MGYFSFSGNLDCCITIRTALLESRYIWGEPALFAELQQRFATELMSGGGREFVEQMRRFADVGIEEVHVMPFTGDPVTYVRAIGDHVMSSLNEL
mgnify:CR=1 FL=1